MHDDVCRIALDKGTSLVIIPFYKRFHVNGALQSSKKAIKIANQNVLDMAPCSVAILVDRGALKTRVLFGHAGLLTKLLLSSWVEAELMIGRH